MQTDQMSVLYIVRAIHSAADLGRLGEDVRRLVGDSAWEDRQLRIKEYWDTVQSCLETLDLQWDHVNLYHDSVLADGPLGRQMVQNLAASGSYDFALVLKLLDKGAILHKTEDIDLLLAEYRVAAGYERPTREAASLALQRDVYIAQRIATTMPPGGAGLLVIGAAHEVEKHLPGGIRLVYLP